MSQLVIAKRYAKALANLAEKEASLENTDSQLVELAEVFSQSEDLQKTLISTKIGIQIKQDILNKILEKLEASSLVQTFTRYLLSKRRILILPDISKAFSQLVREKLGKLEAEITVAESIKDDVLKDLEDKLSQYSGKTVQITVKEDSSIIGGIVARIGSTVIDSSIRSQLNRVRQSIIRG